MVCRFARGTESLSDVAIRKNQHAPRLPSGVARECVALSYLKYDAESGATILEAQLEQTTYLDELRLVSVRDGADREHSLQRGFAIGENGNAFEQQRVWFPVAVRPDSAGWCSQLKQLAEASMLPPELSSVWYENPVTPRKTEKDMLIERVVRHAERYWAAPPSGLTWEEVERRIGTLDKRAYVDEQKAEKARAEREGRKYEEPQRQRRHLELYCGRAPLTVGFARRGWWGKFLDNDRQWVEPTLAEKREDGSDRPLASKHDRGGVRLARDDYIDLDFLDLAVGVFQKKSGADRARRVELVPLDHVHDGFDCSTFSQMAKSTHERSASPQISACAPS